MKKILIAFILITLFKSSYAQLDGRPADWCGTKLSKQQLDWLDNYQRNNALFDNLSARKKSSSTVWIPIKAHIVGKDDASGYYNLDYLFTAISELNTRYIPLNFHFFLYNDLDFINSTSFYNDGNQTNTNAVTAMYTHNVSEALNIYFLNVDPALCGYYTPSTDNVVIFGKNCGNPGGTTIAHEVGHYFSLPHTFFGWEGCNNNCGIISGAPAPPNPEFVKRTNCAASGDKFCDTKADYFSYRQPCPIPTTCVTKDPHGDTLHPDYSLYMSYFDDACVSQFSNEEMGAMRANADTLGLHNKFTLNAPQNAYAVPKSTLLIPADQDFIPQADNVHFSWNSVAGADAYMIVAYDQFSTNPRFAHIIRDTFFVAHGANSFDINSVYQWQVRAFTLGDPKSSSYTSKFSFSTGSILGIESIENSFKIQIAPNPVTKNNGFHIWINAKQTDDAVAKIFSIDGKLLAEKNLSIEAGDKSYSMDVSKLSAGMYFCKMTGSKISFNQSFVVE